MANPARKALKFGYLFSPQDVADPFDPAQLAAQAKLAEAGGFDFIRFHERALTGADTGARTEPFTTASYLATLTKKIGLIASASTSYYEPFNLARLVASLDHVTHGRAGWQLETGASRDVDINFSREAQTPQAHYDRATEVVTILRQLWDSWEDGAFIRNKAIGAYVDGAKIHAIHHKGELFSIKGPLNVARSPQGHAVVAHAIPLADRDLAIDLAVREADLIFLPALPPVELRALSDDLRRELGARGRTALIFADYTPDSPNARAVADRIEALSETGHLDGVNLYFAAPDALARYVAEVVPELRSRRLQGDGLTGDTLRDHLGLSEPANRYAA